MRKAGATFQQIADSGLFADRAAAYNAVKRRLDSTITELGDDLRKVMNERFDTALLAIWPDVQRGDIAAINTMLRIEGQRAKLYGIEAPTRTEVTGDLAVFTISIDRATSEGGLIGSGDPDQYIEVGRTAADLYAPVDVPGSA
jgi:hypothetical protein